MVQKGSRARAIGSLVPAITRKAMERYGFPAAAVLTDWPLIVGSDLAAFTAPERLRWPKGAREGDEAPGDRNVPEGATLVLRVEGPRVLELQHRIPQLLDRINAHFGFRAVTEIRLLQAPIERKRQRKPASTAAPPARARIDPGTVEDPVLREVLERLGGNVSARAARREGES